MSNRLKVLLTNLSLSGRTGTEIVTRNIALALLRQGHSPAVFTLQEGPLCDELRRASIHVATDIGELAGPFDVIHGHHNPTTAIAATRFPDVPAVFVCHDFTAWHDVPPRLANVLRYVAVDAAVADRLTQQERIPPQSVRIILNAVDLDRFLPGPPLPARPVRALLFAKQQGPIASIRAACEKLGIALDVFGPAVNNVTDVPEQLILNYDLVFASALTALECLASGRAVIVCDSRGLAGMVTSQNIREWRDLNLGRRTLRRPVETDLLVAEIERYDAEDAKVVTNIVRAEASQVAQIDAYLACYRAAIDEHRANAGARGETFLRLAQHLQRWGPRPDAAWPWMEERSRLIERCRAAEQQKDPVRIGDAISFALGASPSRHFTMHGFSYAESWGTWTDGGVATLRFEVAEPLPKGAYLELKVLPFITDNHPQLEIRVLANGTEVNVRTFDMQEGARQQDWLLELPELVMPAIWLTFEIRSPASPYDLGMGEDRRKIGLGLIRLNLNTHGDKLVRREP